ncbi:hypothetical protein Gbth_005_136 [Gluconobacter thailandicus F149-1 = NBRC 100600]|uniref:Uncharacterized protein n=1 Tax=Gluconobacter thailandicus NBRC 3257 TaxID=1381097 RepID=A0ABQ0ITC3_GLUTH|nr:hypothetical protein AD946_13155 [Gluconobacter thailandicus]GAC87571.1 hypothetical protein NBRC3255_1232 [Gluconobacter thailandicus NBRC 3255]GAD25469.1 hypothetical protein NBRC3257_0468 [Gluconobacter thailandicus NBRC 3257]GAN90810.1 hypothetical protein Gbfr_021_137 [Gluconobacter frateurii M-2]GAN92135.1 hypothetical protein Gbth_005_136 [Gluconobacter thailandicus F149-1 = NBRC 100600]
MDADLAPYLDETVPSLQKGAERLVNCDCVKKNIGTVANESRALLADLMVDQPFFLLLCAFVSGLLLGRSLFSEKKPS